LITSLAAVFDYFSRFFPLHKKFIVELVAPRLPLNASVTDVGAGTGLFDLELLEHAPSIHLSLIDPSPDMMPIAQQRLRNRVQYYPCTIEQTLPILPQQDAFIFQRSLYAIYKNETHCKKLFAALNKKTNIYGHIFILDFPRKVNLQEIWDYLTSLHADFLPQWRAFELACEQFNQGVDSGIFHLFTSKELDNLLKSAGFIKLLETADFCHIYSKQKTV
jgi:ubiquinone/menaquinone biosynthesis C-methylase UbiE